MVFNIYFKYIFYMIKENFVLVEINLRNISHYRGLGYEIPILKIGDKFQLETKVEDVPRGSHFKITAVCDNCESENIIPLFKYYSNVERNNKGYYSCFKCKNLVKEKTCMDKYGVRSYSQTEDFKNIDRSGWNYDERIGKARKTNLERYGVEHYFETERMREQNKTWMSSEEFREKSKKTLVEKYGVDSYSKTSDFKSRILSSKESINERIRNTFLEKYGVEFFSKTNMWKENYRRNISEIRSKIENTCLEKYGVKNVSQVKEIYDKILDTKKSRGIHIEDSFLSDWEKYKRKCRSLTSKIKKKVYENWDGYDYYDREYIMGNVSYVHTNRMYPTIDHKISVFYGFSNNISPEEICQINNLCITKRWINCSKNYLIEENFKL